MCKTWWRSKTQHEKARKGVGWAVLSMEEEVVLVGHTVKEGASKLFNPLKGLVGLSMEVELPEEVVEALGVENSHIGQIWKGVLPLPNRPL